MTALTRYAFRMAEVPSVSDDVYEAKPTTASNALLGLPLTVRLNCVRRYLEHAGWLDDEAVADAVAGRKPQKERWAALAERDPALVQAGALALGTSIKEALPIARECEIIVDKWWENSRSSADMLKWVETIDPRAGAWGLLACVSITVEELPELRLSRIRMLRRALRSQKENTEIPELWSLTKDPSDASARTIFLAVKAVENTLRNYLPVALSVHLDPLAQLHPEKPRRIRDAYEYGPDRDTNSPSLWKPMSELFPKVLRKAVRCPQLSGMLP